MSNCTVCNSDKTKESFTKNDHNIHKCKNCGSLFVFPLPENLEDVYQETYFFNSKKEKTFGYVNYDQDKEPMRPTFNKYLSLLTSYTAPSSIFDVGAATGFFLDIARDSGWQTHGVELSSFAAGIAKERGHNVVAGTIQSLEVATKHRVVTMWDVLEHVKDPQESLCSANKLLEDEGYLTINSPDAGSWWAKLLGKRWHLFVPPEHLHYFTKKGLRKMLERNGFKIIEFKKIGKSFSLSYIFTTLYNWQGLAIWKYLAKVFDTPFWRKLALPINLRDNIFVLAKKVKNV